jgi:hypothetical protein
MDKFWHWWTALPEGYRVAIISGMVAVVSGVILWIVTKELPPRISSYLKRKHDQKVEILSHAVWSYIKQQSGGSTTAIRFSSVVSHFNISAGKAREALRLLQAKGLIWTMEDESLWYSEAKTRFFN